MSNCGGSVHGVATLGPRLPPLGTEILSLAEWQKDCWLASVPGFPDSSCQELSLYVTHIHVALAQSMYKLNLLQQLILENLQI